MNTENNDLIINFMGEPYMKWLRPAYHFDWRWILSVVEKIRFRTDCSHLDLVKWKALINSIETCLLNMSIQDTYDACIDFIKWYNEQQLVKEYEQQGLEKYQYELKETTIEEQFIPYEQALALKELGFDYPCFATYNTNKGISRNPSHNMEDLPIEGQPYYWNNSKIHVDITTAPLYQQAFDWILKRHSLYSVSIPTINMAWTFKTTTVIEGIIEVAPYKHVDSTDYSTKKEADIASLKKLIELIRKNHEGTKNKNT